MARLSKKVAVITGGASGIGLATAKAFVEHGARVVLFSRDEKALKAAADSLGPAATTIAGDVKKTADLERLYAHTKATFGNIDILFANAGIVRFIPLEMMDEANVDDMLATNVKGTFFTVQKAVPILNPGASVILTASAVDETGAPTTSLYAATKAAIRSLARTMSGELVAKGIRVNALSPGATATPIFGKAGVPQEALGDMAKGFESMIPMRRFARPDEMANAAVFLASDESSYMLGSELTVDGGFSQI